MSVKVTSRMNTKSHVGMGFKICPICYAKHDEVVLLDKRLKDSLERDNFMGFDLCPEHEAMREEYVALVEVTNNACHNLEPEDAKTTGRVAHVKRTAIGQIFNVQFPADMPMCYVEVGMIDALKAWTGDASDSQAV